MDARKMKRYAALLVAGAAGLATTLTGCGGSEPSKTAGAASTSGASSSGTAAPTTSALPATVDINDPVQVASVLNLLGIETPASEPLERHRGSGAEGVAFPTWPAGDVRKEGLATYRIDATGGYQDDGTLKFMKGNKVLHEAAFKPSHERTVASLPQAVAESLKVGDTVTWGVWFANKKAKPATVSFTIVDKPQVTRAEAKLYGDRSVGGVVREIARAKILQNYRFYSEAVSIYTAIVEDDGRVTSAYTPIAECLTYLKLKNTPLFELADSRRPTLNVGGGGLRPVPVTTAGLGSGAGVSKNGPGPHPMGSTPATGSASGTPGVPGTPAPAPDGTTASGPSFPTPVPPLLPTVPSPSGPLPTAPPGGEILPAGPTASGPVVPPLNPTSPTHPANQPPDHPAVSGPAHPAVGPTAPDHPAGGPTLPHVPGEPLPPLPPGEQGPVPPTPELPPAPPPEPTPVLPTPEPTPIPVPPTPGPDGTPIPVPDGSPLPKGDIPPTSPGMA